MYYLVKWRDGQISRFFSFTPDQAKELILSNFDVYSVIVDPNQSD